MKMETKPVRKVNPFNPVTGREIPLRRKFVTVVTDGSGCGLENCNCSPPNFISVADGKTLIVVELNEEEAAAVRTGNASIDND